jgi:hypothetical protein
MASGDTLFTLLPLGSIPTATVYATLDTIADGSTPAGAVPVLDYDGAAANEHADWVEVMPSHYAGGGLTFTIYYAASGTDGSDIQFEVRAVKTVGGDTITTENLGGATGTDITDTPNGTANVMDVTPTGAITHANAGEPVAGNVMRIRVTRDFDHAANTDDAQVVAVHVAET